jgi:putative ABC transport system permease protein
MEPLIRELRHAATVLRRRPWFTAAAVLCLALGLGATSAIFTIVNTVLLRPLPYADSDHVMMLWNQRGSQGLNLPVSAAEYVDFRDQNQTFSGIAVLIANIYGLTGEGLEPERVTGARVSGNFMTVLGVRLQAGRNFLPEEDRFGNEHEVILSNGYWRRRFGADPKMVGRAINLDGSPTTVVGVMPPNFTFGDVDYDVFAPIGFNPKVLTLRKARGLTMVGHLKPGATPQQARADLNGIVRRFRQQFPSDYKDSTWKVAVVPILDDLVGGVRPALMVLLGAVALVLLIACANVANLLLARASAREKEVAIRLALGAGRGRIVRQFLLESLLLSLAGGAVGLLLAGWGVKALVASNPYNIPRLEQISLDGRAIAFTVLVCAVAALFFGLAPALQAARTDFHGALKEGGKTSAVGSGGQRMRSALVIFEVALALMVLVGAGLVLKSFRKLAQSDPGFRPKGVLTASVLLPRVKYGAPAKSRGLFRELLPRIGSIPGVRSVSMVSALPLGTVQSLGNLASHESGSLNDADQLTVNRLIVDTGYFQTMDIALRRGRLFTAADDERATGVAMIDEGLAKRLWPNEDPIGRRFRLDPDPFPGAKDGRLVVGVVGTVRQQALGEPSLDQIYLPYAQLPSTFMSLVLRADAELSSLTHSVRATVTSVDHDLPVSNVHTMEEVLAASLTRARVNALLFGIFALVALALAVVGVYGVMAYSVAQRTHEIGIRMSLGAQSRDVLRMVIRQGMALTAAGLAVGLIASIAATRAVASLLYGVSSTDVLTFAEVLLLLAALAWLASFVPARKATRIDPMMAMRYE